MNLQKVKEIIAEHFSVDPADLSPETDLVKELHADSLDLVELIMAFEDAFDLTIPDEVAMAVRKISDIVDYLEKSE
ncbi:MAG: acyl carrier protein [Clostridia bacterium]|nr:acyl carrier protein [Clostridia bacterium]